MMTMLTTPSGGAPKVTGLFDGEVSLPSGSPYVKLLDRASVGPAVILTYNINPDETENDSALRVVVDGTIIHSATGLDPSGNNYLIGTAFDTMTAGSGDAGEPAIAACFCAVGFELWGYRTAAGGVDAQYTYATYEV
jgi:hypothetical protein